MNKLTEKQENNDLIQSHSFAKNHVSAHKSVKESSTKLSADINPENTVVLYLSSKLERKAFGNVSNVTENSINSVKKEVEKCAINTGVKDSVKAVVNAPHTQVTNTAKCFDEIENMDRISEQELSELNDPITADLFAIDDNIIYSQHFGDDIPEHLIAQKVTDDDIDNIF